MIRDLSRLLVFTLTAAATLSSPVHAATVVLSDAVYGVQVDNYSPLGGNAPVSANSSLGSAQAGLPASGGEVIPFVEANASGPDEVTAGESYQFAVLAPANTIVPVWFSGNLQASGSLAAGASAQVFSLGGNTVLYRATVCSPATCLPTAIPDPYGPQAVGNYSYETVLNVATNTAYEIQLNTRIYGGPGSAISDPFVQIDPAFLAANLGDTLEFSAGIDNVSPIPLPPALPMFGSALLVLGAFARHWREQCRHNI